MQALQSILKENAFFVAFLLLLGIAFVVLRTKETDIGSVSELDAMLSRGVPTLIEFYSNT